MSCNCDSPQPAKPSDTTPANLLGLPTATPGNPIDIQTPVEGPSNLTVKDGCYIDTSGTISDEFPAHRLNGIFARIGGGTEVAGTYSTVNYRDWSVPNVPGAHWHPGGVRQTVSVRGLFSAPSGTSAATNNRDFIGNAGNDYSCYAYDHGKVGDASAVALLPIEEIMPRYFRVQGEFGGQTPFGMMAGGLVSLAAIHLSFDPQQSSPECAVWRDVGLPPGLGSWLLRVIRSKAGYEAHLSFQAMTERSVMPAIIAMTRHWSFDQSNLLHSVMEVGVSQTAVTLHVVPL